MGSKEKGRLVISSPVFDNEGEIPERYTCDGDNINPPLVVDQIPKETESLAIIMEDPDAPNGTFDHWLVWNIPPKPGISENSNPGINGVNGKGKTGYHGPCPPDGTHRYFFHVYALDTSLDLSPQTDKEVLRDLIQPHILAEGSLLGMYGKLSKIDALEHTLEHH
jgi:Raf kinase inhibitor-like YbhB/YbcL family protein